MKMKNKEVIVFSVPRSGGTLIANILQDILGKKIRDSHGYEVLNDKTIICLRDFRDCFASKYKLDGNEGKMGLIKIIKYYFFFNRYIKSLEKYKKNESILVLRYEEFFNNFNYIFDKIEDHFGMKIKERERDKIAWEYDIESIKEGMENAKEKGFNFSNDKIPDGKIGKWREIINPIYHNLIYFLLRERLLKYGYWRDKWF